jgi:hypothetical protein
MAPCVPITHAHSHHNPVAKHISKACNCICSWSTHNRPEYPLAHYFEHRLLRYMAHQKKGTRVGLAFSPSTAHLFLPDVWIDGEGMDFNGVPSMSTVRHERERPKQPAINLRTETCCNSETRIRNTSTRHRQRTGRHHCCRRLQGVSRWAQ